jgi:hypothetical protein
MLKILLLGLALAGLGRADETDSSDFQPSDALYAPENASPSAAAELRATYYSTARLSVVDAGHGMRPLEGAELFIDGKYVGKSPLDLSGFLVDKPSVALSARLGGYNEALRPALSLPAEGEARIAMSGDNAASWYTTPAFVVGLLAMGGAVAVYAQNDPSTSDSGLALVCGGVAVIALSQAVAHFIHLPALEKSTAALNARPEPLP